MGVKTPASVEAKSAETSSTTENRTQTTITPPSGWHFPDLREMWEFREMLYFLTLRDVRVRYKQTIVGPAWAVIRPIMQMIVFTAFFNGLLNVAPDGDAPYPIWSYAALVPWAYFATSLNGVALSLVSNANMVKKTYFPRMLLPLTKLIVPGVDFLIAFVTLLVMMLAFGYTPTINILWLPLFFLVMVITTLGIGLWFAAMHVQFRDAGYVVAFLVQIWLYITPVAYPSELLEGPAKTFYMLNPMVLVVDGFRWALIGTDTAPEPINLISVAIALIVLLTGLLYFQRMEKSFADVV